jgi:uncharacterized protein (TIGR00730 family)
VYSVCVYASSSDRVGDRYREAAADLGAAMAARGWGLVYGGAKIGLMGEIARAVAAGGGTVVGVIPRHIADHGLAFKDADEIVVTETLRERKAMMEARSDAFVALPGGFGTHEELLEIITLKQLHRHDKPVCMLDIDGFYQPLVALFEHLYTTRFARSEYRSLYAVCPGVNEALGYLESYTPEQLGDKWS